MIALFYRIEKLPPEHRQLASVAWFSVTQQQLKSPEKFEEFISDSGLTSKELAALKPTPLYKFARASVLGQLNAKDSVFMRLLKTKTDDVLDGRSKALKRLAESAKGSLGIRPVRE